MAGVTEAAVTDTHPLLFHAAGSRRLGRRAADVFDAAERQAAIIYVALAAVIWECGLLAWDWASGPSPPAAAVLR